MYGPAPCTLKITCIMGCIVPFRNPYSQSSLLGDSDEDFPLRTDREPEYLKMARLYSDPYQGNITLFKKRKEKSLVSFPIRKPCGIYVLNIAP